MLVLTPETSKVAELVTTLATISEQPSKAFSGRNIQAEKAYNIVTDLDRISSSYYINLGTISTYNKHFYIFW